MDVRKVLLALHPRAWRREYGDEFLAFLEDTPLHPIAVADVVGNAARLHAQVRQGALRIVAALAVSVVFEIVAVKTRLTANILWAPTSPARAIALVMTVSPWLLLAASWSIRRIRRDELASEAGR
jgi:hypothetical protein